MRNPPIVERILSRLQRAEWREIDPWYRDDLRISWITVLRASRCEPIPFVTATYTVLGLHPDKVFPAIEARRSAILGAECLPRKKPVQSVRTAEGAKTQAARDHESRAV